MVNTSLFTIEKEAKKVHLMKKRKLLLANDINFTAQEMMERLEWIKSII
jgi:hypothetical protein